MASSPFFDRQRKKIRTWVSDIMEEIAVNKTFLGRVKDHSEHMMQDINVSSAETFPIVFAEASSSLLKYSQILNEINCQLEALLTKEIRQWNTIYIADNSANIQQFKLGVNQKKVTESSVKDMPLLNLKHKKKEETQLSSQINKSADLRGSNIQGCSNVNLHSGKAVLNKKCESRKKKRKSKSVEKGVQVKKKVGTNSKKTATIIKTSSQVLEERKKSSTNCVKLNLDVPKKKEDAVKNMKKEESIKEINVSYKKKYKASITHALSPLEFYVCFDTLRMEKCFKELEIYMKKYKFPTSKPKGKTIALRKKAVMNLLGTYALLKSPSSLVQRVKITNWMLKNNNDLVTVYFVDIGNTRNVSLYDLHPIPKEFMRYPSFATRCHLAGVAKEEDQSSKVIGHLRNLTARHETVTVIASAEKGSLIPKSLPVIIYGESEAWCLNKLILDKLEEPEKLEESLEKWDPMCEAYESNKNMYDFDVDDPAASIYGYVGNDYERVCKLYGNTGKCYKKACKKEHVFLDTKGYTTDKEEVYIRAFHPLKMPRVDTLKVRVTHIESPSSFYCVMDNPENGTKEETLLTLHSYMNQRANISEMKKLSIPPGVGQIVLAKFPRDNFWSRARVVSVLPEKDEYTLFYVDIGSTNRVLLSSIRAIEPRYLHLPFQAIFCEISGVGEKSEIYRLAVEYMDENLTGICTLEIVSTLPGEHPHLLVNLYTNTGENMAEKLLINKLVDFKENVHLDETKLYLPG